MAELADALDLGSSGATRTGSIPASCTNWQIREYYVLSFSSLLHLFSGAYFSSETHYAKERSSKEKYHMF